MAEQYPQSQLALNTDISYPHEFQSPASSSALSDHSSRSIQCFPTSPLHSQYISPIQPPSLPNILQVTSTPSPQLSDYALSPHPSYRFPNDIPYDDLTKDACTPTPKPAGTHQRSIAHPYARLYAKKDSTKRHRKIWNHALEKLLFNSHELATMGAPHRRTIYIASLEAHVDRLHAQLLDIGLYPIPFSKLEPYRGLNSKTAKSMVAGLQNDNLHSKLKILELERSNGSLREMVDTAQASKNRRHSADSYRAPSYQF